jgi:hypothetical protein
MRPDEAPPASASALGSLSAMAGGAAVPAAGGSASSAASAPTGFVANRGVSQAETSHSMAPSVLASTARRLLVFEDVEVRRSRARGVLCRVTLTREGTEYVGESEGQESERSRIELSARATLQAIATATTATPGGEKSIALEGAKLIDAFDRAFVFVSLSARVGREPVVLTGSCEVRESAETSAVLAVLDATNRWVHFDR